VKAGDRLIPPESRIQLRHLLDIKRLVHIPFNVFLSEEGV
jgi:hypothetical protein